MTPADLTHPGTRPGVVQLRRLECELVVRLARLDARVDALLEREMHSDAEIGELDVLCAAIAEARELLDEVQGEIGLVERARRARRRRAKRWV